MKNHLFLILLTCSVITPIFTTNVQAQNVVIVYQSVWAAGALPTDGSFNWNSITHLIMFGAEPMTTPPYNSFRNDAGDTWLNAAIADGHAHGVKMIFSIGGVGGNLPDLMALDSATIHAAIVSWVNHIVAYNYDGAEIDWETRTDAARFDKLCRMFRAEYARRGFSTPKLLMAAIGRTYLNAGNPIFFASTINTYLDYAMSMNYDANQLGSCTSGFHNPLFDPKPNWPTMEGGFHGDIATCTQGFLDGGVNPSKFVMGLSLYPRIWYRNHIFKPAMRTIPGFGFGCTGDPNICEPAQPEIGEPSCNEGIANWIDTAYPMILAGATEHYDTLAAMAWLGDSTAHHNTGLYLNYNNRAAFSQKMTYINSLNPHIAGVMLFANEHGAAHQGQPIMWNGHLTQNPLMDDFRAALSPSAPSIATQPSNTSANVGATAAFTVVATGAPTAYQWQRNHVNIGGATNSSYTTSALTLGNNGDLYRCVVSNFVGSAISNDATLSVSAATVANPTSDDFSNTARFANLWKKSHPQLTSLIGGGTSDAFLRLNLDATAHEMGGNVFSAVRVLQDITDGNFEVVAKFQTLPSATYQWEGILVKENATSFLRFDILKDNGGIKFYAGKASATNEQKILASVNIPGLSVWVKVKREANVWTASYSADGSTFIQTGQFVQAMVVDSIGVYAGNQTGGSGVPAFDCKVDYFFNVNSPINPEDPVSGAPTGTFTASIDTLPAGGGNVTLTWTSNGADSAKIDQGVGAVALAGSTTVVVGQTKSFTLTLKNGLGSQSYILGVYVPLQGGGSLQDITSSGTPVALITNPTGTGSRNLEVIRDGITPPSGSSNPDEQYDTFSGGGSRLVDWMGYTYASIQSFGSITLQEGIHAAQGGFFAGTPRVEVRVGAQWIDVQGLTITPAYGGGSAPNFTTYTLSFNSVSGDGIRITGVPGGTAQYLSVAELRVMGNATSTVEPNTKPKNFDLLHNYPNPFNPTTTIEFTVSTPAHVTLEIYNILGQKIRTLVDQAMEQGKWPVTWDGRDESNRLVSSGIYLYKLQAGDFVATQKMILSK